MVGAIFLTALQPTLAILALRPAQSAALCARRSTGRSVLRLGAGRIRLISAISLMHLRKSWLRFPDLLP